MERETYRSVIGRFATGVAVVTADGPNGPGGMTANAVCSLSLEPLLLLVCFENTARTLPIARAAGSFGVNILRADQSELSRRFASKRAESAKFDGVPWSALEGVPVLDGVIAWLACDLREMHPAGDHTIAIGAVRAMNHDAEGDPLIWYRGGYDTVARATSPQIAARPD